MRTMAFAVLALLAAMPACGQTTLDNRDLTKFNTLFDQAQGDPLKCNLRTMDPRVDFGFRFILAYHADCEIKQFGGKATGVKVFWRITPEGGAEQAFADSFEIPQAPPGFDLNHLKHVHSSVQFSGAVAAGIGSYDMAVLVVDEHDRIFRKHWKAKAYPHGRERDLNFLLLPGALASLAIPPIGSKTENGLALTVLLNAAPLNPWSRKLWAWDRAFLLDSLASLLRQVPHSSVRVVAFNLEQQTEIFRQDDFTQQDMRKLAQALRRLELGTVTYRTLERQNGWAELLLRLLKEESHAEDRSQALVFLGPTLRLSEKLPAEMLSGNESPAPALPLFCVTYYPRIGADFPDSVQYLTTAFKGKIFRIHSPSELGQNLEKLQRDMEAGATAKMVSASKSHNLVPR